MNLFYSLAGLIMVLLFNQALGNEIMDAKSDSLVIQWTSEGGLVQSTSKVADLTVFADGRIKIGPRLANGKVVTEQLSKADFKALYRFVFEEKDILSINSVELDQEIKAAVASDADIKPGANTIPLATEAIADAATTFIRVRKGEHEHKISHYNLYAHAQHYPKIKDIQRLRAIELHLLELAQKVATAAR